MKYLSFIVIILSLRTSTFSQTNCTTNVCQNMLDNSLPFQRTSSFEMGINGSPLRQAFTQRYLYDVEYTSEELISRLKPLWKKQFQYLKELGITYYRIPVSVFVKAPSCSGCGGIGDVPWAVDNDSRYTPKGSAVYRAYCDYSKTNELGYAIENLIVLDRVEPNFGLSEADNYLLGYNQTRQFYIKNIDPLSANLRPKYFELSNEVTDRGRLDNSGNKIISSIGAFIYANPTYALDMALAGKLYGDKIIHYNLPNAKKLVAYLKGMDKGLKEDAWGAANIKTLFGSAANDYGFLEVIGDYNSTKVTSDKFNYNYISWHFYNANDSRLDANNKQTYASFTQTQLKNENGIIITQNTLDKIIAASNYPTVSNIPSKEIWMTEFGHLDGFAYPNEADFYATKKIVTTNMIDELHRQDAIKKIFYYALYDDVRKSESTKWSDRHGLFKWDDDIYTVELKTNNFEVLQNEYQYRKTGYEDLTEALHVDLDKRLSSSPDSYWPQKLKCTKNTCGVIRDILNQEFLPRYIKDQYYALIGRQLDPNYSQDAIKLSTYIQSLSQESVSFENFKRDLIAGPNSEFQVKANQEYPSLTPNEAFLKRLCKVLLNRPALLGPSDTWLTALNNGTSKAHVAESFIKSEEYRKHVISQGFSLVLKRSVGTVPNSDYWYQRFVAGTTDEYNFLISLFQSQEYRDRSKKLGSIRRLNSCPTNCTTYVAEAYCYDQDAVSCNTTYPHAIVTNGPLVYVKEGYSIMNLQNAYFRKEEVEESLTNSQPENQPIYIKPNPFSDGFSLQNDEAIAMWDITIYNEMGQEQVVKINVKDSHSLFFDANSLQEGIYLLRGTINDRNVVIKILK